MNIEQLQQLFSGLPESFIQEMKSKDFKTCWYGSSYLDKRPMVFADSTKPNTKFQDSIDVFFYTDLDFFVKNQELYTQYSGGRIIFNKKDVYNYDPEIENIYGEITNFSIENYILPGEIIYADLLLQKDGIIPKSLDANGFYLDAFYNKLEMRAKYLEFDKIKQKYIDNPPSQQQLDAIEYLKSVGLYNYPLGFDEIPNQLITRENNFDFSVYDNRAVLVKHFKHNRDSFYTFYVDIDDHTFEQILLDKQLKIDYAAKSNGWAGPGPSEQYRQRLGWEWLNYNQ
jgi:hypothetical protein